MTLAVHAPGIRSKGRRGSTIVPNWRWSDPSLDAMELRIAGYLASHVDTWLEEYVTRKVISDATHISAGKVSGSITKLAELGIITVDRIDAGGRIARWVITFDHDVWEQPDAGHHMTSDWSPGDQEVADAGHHMTKGWSPDDQHKDLQEEEQKPGEQQEDEYPSPLNFDAWWTQVPNKDAGGKGEARTVWATLSPSDKRAAYGGIRRHTKLILGSPGLYVLPAMNVWLSKRRWEDDEPRRPPAKKREGRENPYAEMLRSPDVAPIGALATGSRP